MVIASTHMFLVWAQLAIKSERRAHEARTKMLTTRNGQLQRDETEATLVTVVGVASALEALRHEVSHKVSPRPLADWEEERRGSVANDILATLRLAFELEQKEWSKRLNDLFQLRNQAVHPRWRSGGTIWHPSGLHKTTKEFVTFSREAAEAAIDLLLALLAECVKRPKHLFAEWASGVSDAIEELREMRSAGLKS